ncbi:multidrug efflux MFS transporter [Nocardioides sp. zg-536]|uniref:Multidrug efflux MFS transporter n=1 Tax=Nocardioides faecalis TaxID=2803858 RepID=A0A938Y552_9ACTN|nr:MDR family MFS transporter [Nocardioides faecalis]MBM9458438.1 multidrug efflux MFS transporter [Nocardioides faecalis]QVI58452.1 multidrug efflux MFS transporter [Nocardioides faecalis]
MNSPEATPANASERLDRSVIITGLVIVSGLVMVVLDSTIVNVALDTLSKDLKSSLSTTQWLVTGYLLAVAMVIPLTGWAMDRFGAKPTWLTALSLFIIGSALCATAWNIESLITFRILQGLGGGMLMPAGQAMIARAAGPERMGRAMAILGVPMLLGPVFGPVVGGALVEYSSWHWIFLVNVPIGILAIALAVWRLPNEEVDADVHLLDWLGLVLLSGSLAALLYGLSEASSKGGFDHSSVLGWLIGGAIGLALYVAHSVRKGEESILDVRLLTNRLFTMANIAVFLVAVGLFGGMLLLPLYYQTVRGEGALDAGLLLAPQGLGAVASMVIAGRLTDRFGAGYVVPVGVTLALLGTFPFTQVGIDTSYWLLTVALFVRGMGLGAVMMPTISSAYLKLSQDKVTRATPALSAVQQIGASLGSAILVTVLSAHLTGLLADRGMRQQDPGGGSDSLAASLSPQARSVVGPLMADSFGFAFWIALGLTALIYIPALFMPRFGRHDRASDVRDAPDADSADATAAEPPGH